MRKLNILIFFFLSLQFTWAHGLPGQPSDSSHPGSSVYLHSLYHETFTVGGRTVEFYAPADFKTTKLKLSLIVFGHGQATPVSGYNETFEHLAKKGIAVIFPQYDSGFFDQDWRRMAVDYVTLTTETLKKYPASLDAQKVIFAGHSKGGYIAIIAAGLPQAQQSTKPAAVILFDPAGFDSEYITTVDPRIPVTVTWADQDTVINESLIHDIFEKLPSQKKQYIKLRSYVAKPADHFFSVSKKFFFGGSDGISPFHYYGTWKWLLGAAWDLQAGGQVNNPYIYGDLAGTNGDAGPGHTVLRNW